MKNILVTSLLCLLVLFLSSQNINLSLANPQPNLEDAWGGDFASGDIDGDGDNDLLITGISPGKVTALYLNDGIGGFTEVTDIPFPESSGGDIIFSDLDLDGDLDLFFSGNGTTQDFVFLNDFTHIYLNDGAANFSQMANTGLPDSQVGRVVIGDLDGDNDPDIIMSMNQVYLNNGSSSFSLAGTIPSGDFQYGVMELIDAENDGDLDVFISGEKLDNSESLELFINDGSANFLEDLNSSFIQMAASDIDAGDLDGDGDFEVLYSGIDINSNVRTIAYENNGLGGFTQSFNVGVQQTFAGTNSIADLDNDGDQDLIIIGSQAGGFPNIYGFIYENTGNGFSPVDIIGGEYIANNLVDDFNGDGFLDIIVQGFVDKTNIYFNQSEGSSQGGVLGCTNSAACNFNSLATIPDDSCDYSCLGCTDIEALNFDAAHSIEDGSCVFCTDTCPGDFDGDGAVNVSDLGGFLGAFGSSCSEFK